MMQSYGSVPSPAINSSADANPRAPYPSDESESTSAARNDLSSSITAIKCSVDTDHPFSGICGDGEPQERAVLPNGAASMNYTAVLLLSSATHYGCSGLTNSAIRTRSARVRAP